MKLIEALEIVYHLARLERGTQVAEAFIAAGFQVIDVKSSELLKLSGEALDIVHDFIVNCGEDLEDKITEFRLPDNFFTSETSNDKRSDGN